MSFIWKLVIFLGILDFTGFASTINTEFEIIFLMRFTAKSSLTVNCFEDSQHTHFFSILEMLLKKIEKKI